MALKYTNNEVAEDFLQNENLQSKRYTAAHSTNTRIYKNNSSGIKYGLSELSNDKTYLETELPARKRLKPETELINATKYLNKTCKAVANDDDSGNVIEGKYSCEISCILSREQEFENNSPSQQLLRSNLNAEINTQNESSVSKSGTCNSVFQRNTLDNQLKLDSNQSIRYNFERESEIHDIELDSEKDLCENVDDDKISNRGTESETDFDDEVNKCYELLNLDVPRMAVSTSETKIANNNSGNKIIQNSQNHKCEINNHNKSLDSLSPQSTELVTNLKTMSNGDINLGTIFLGKNLKMQHELLNKKEKKCEDSIEFKDESNSVLYTIVTSNSFLKACNENRINSNQKFFCNDNLGTEDNSLDWEFKDKNENSTIKINNILNFNGTSVREPNIFIPETTQNRDSKNNTEYLDLTIENTLNSDILKLKGTNHNILKDHSNDDDEIGGIPSIVDDSADILSLYYDSDFDETEEEINMTNLSESEPAILERASKNNGSIFHGNPDHDNNSCKYSSNEVKYISNFILNEKIDSVDVSHTLDDENCELHVLKGISNNDFDIKVDTSFVSEYEISLLADDTDSILSEESLDSEYEISLLEGDTDYEENKNNLPENKSDSNVSFRYLPNDDEKDEKIEAIPQECIKEQEKEQITNNVNLFEKETDEVISENKIYSKSIVEGNITSSTEEKIPSNYQKNKVTNKTDSDVKKSIQEEEIQTFSNIESSECTSVKLEPVTGFKIIQKLQTTLSYEKPVDIKKEPSENTNCSYFPLKLEINNESQIKSKEISNSNNLEEKALIVDTNKHLAGSACTNIASIAKIVKAELVAPDIDELKQNVTDGFKSSYRVVFNSKMNETKKKSEEKVTIANTNKQFVESTFNDKVIAEKIVKTDLGSSESKQDARNIIPELFALDVDELKQNVTDGFKSSNREVFNSKMNETKMSEEKVPIPNTNKQSAESTFTDKAITEKIVKTDSGVSASSESKQDARDIIPELVTPDVDELKQNATDGFKSSNRVVFNSRMNETKMSEEKVPIAHTNKQLTESTFTDKVIAEKIVKTDLGVSASSELQQDVKDIIPDYYEEEKEDLINPGWNKIKELSTDEERYRQVKDCWKSKNIPDPFKNLTYYSYRKRKINHGENDTHQTRQHKRHASNNLNEKNAKRSRSCTYIFDDRIMLINQEKEMKAKTIHDKMFNEVNRLNELQQQEEMGIQNFYGFGFDPRRQYELNDLRRIYEREVSAVTAQYEQKVNDCYDQYTSEINKLRNNRNEVLQFYSFYKGLNTDKYKDPTVLTNTQMQELEEIENIYKQMDFHYR